MKYDNYMNISLGNQINVATLSPMLIGEMSPYLSPLNGSLTVLDHSSPDQLLDFQLQVQSFNPIYQQLQHQPSNNTQQLFLQTQDYSSEQYLTLKQQYKYQKSQVQTPTILHQSNYSKIYTIIEFLVINDALLESDLLSLGKPLYQHSLQFQSIFKILLNKFKKLKKTKQQMIKYCMRKVFKFVIDLKKNNTLLKTKKDKSQKNLHTQLDLNIEIPFRKNSSEKTMNTQFLKNIFNNKQFLHNYSEFLNQITKIIEDDNTNKIAYLSQTIEKILNNSNTPTNLSTSSIQLKQIQKIKRLPWTKTILIKTQQLAKSLTEFANTEINSLEEFHLMESK